MSSSGQPCVDNIGVAIERVAKHPPVADRWLHALAAAALFERHPHVLRTAHLRNAEIGFANSQRPPSYADLRIW
jgi:hypothetical protein